MRLTKLDDCCTPPAVAAPCSMIVSKGFISVAYSPEISQAEEIEVKNAAGEICISDPGCDELKWINTTITLCNVDPDILAFVTDSPLVLNAAGASVGNRIQTGQACGTNFGLEVWTDVPSDVCAANGGKQYGYFLLPCVSSGMIGDFTIENGALNLELNAKARSGSGWGVGPYNVDLTAGPPAAPGPLLTPIGPDDVLDLHLTEVAPPVASCGCVPLAA
ncbi:MAG: hypothetical protein LC792_00010 [Actinobacteria bacterium]|nr:hypothetical protein [Actinomycetota bacterium]